MATDKFLVSVQQQTPIEINGKLRRRFYEAVKFEEALSQACSRNSEKSSYSPVDGGVDTEGSALLAFRSFVNRIAHVCDFRKGGTTVTAVAIIQEFDSLHYFVGSNGRSEKEQAQLHFFVSALLRIPTMETRITESSRHAFLLHTTLGLVIKHNQPRIKFYVSKLLSCSESCILALDADADQSSHSM